MKRKRLLIIFLLIMIILMSTSKSVFADTIEEIEYNGSEDIVIQTDNSLVPFNTVSRKNENFIVSQINSFFGKIGAIFDSTYRTQGLKVKQQGTTGECWAFAYTSAYEAYNLIKNGITDIYSPRHIDYSCSQSVTGAPESANLFNRETTENGGNYFLATAYAASGKGVVLEDEMPFSQDVSKKESYEELISKKAKKQLDKSIMIDSIYKINNGENIIYYSDSSYQNELSEAEVVNIRSTIKEQIKENGSVATTIYEETDSPNICVTDNKKIINHAVLIVGWDDDYQAEGWKNKGAYIALNSYGTELFDNGYIYISYDDIWVENGMVGICKTSEVDFDNVYEYDPFGAVSAVYSSALSNESMAPQNLEEISAINIFKRDASKLEELKEIGVSLFSYQKAEVYFSEDFDEKTGLPKNFKKVANMTDTLSPGFTTIQFESPITLTKDKFAVCVRFVQDNIEKIATVAIEGRMSNNKWWDNVTGNAGESYFVDVFDPNGNNIYWSLSARTGDDTYHRNASIKAYTSDVKEIEISITSSEYSVNKDNKMITRVPVSTDINDFKNKITVSVDYKIIDKNGNEINEGIIKTGYKIKVQNVEYQIAVIGDISGDGLLNTLDLARMRFHIGEKPGYVLQGIYLEAADISGNGEVNVVDLARFRRDI